jgi:hypothetical protein
MYDLQALDVNQAEPQWRRIDTIREDQEGWCYQFVTSVEPQPFDDVDVARDVAVKVSANCGIKTRVVDRSNQDVVFETRVVAVQRISKTSSDPNR